MTARLGLVPSLLLIACSASSGEPTGIDLDIPTPTPTPTPTSSLDSDQDGYLQGVDCDDFDPNTHPGAPEVCDFEDNDCDGISDEGVTEPPPPKPKILMVGEGDNALPFACLLSLNGYDVVRLPNDGDFSRNTDLQNIEGFVLLNGLSDGESMGQGGEDALLDFVAQGGGFVSTEWTLFDVKNGVYPKLGPLLPVNWGDLDEDARSLSKVWDDHPITVGIDPFDLSEHSFSYGSLKAGATAILKDDSARPAMALMPHGQGRSLWFSIANGYRGFDWLNSPELTLLFVRSVDYSIGKGVLAPGYDPIIAQSLCEGDRDQDGVPDGLDNCPDVHNAGQYDADEDTIGNACDTKDGCGT